MSFLGFGKKTKGWKIDKENIISFDDGYCKTVSKFFPDIKRFESTFFMNGIESLKQMYEYKISVQPDPTEVYIRLKDMSSNEPSPDHFHVKDGVVLENQIARDTIEGLQKEVLWHKIELHGGATATAGYAQLFFILSKHPDIVPKAEYLDFLRKTQTRIILGVSKVQEVVKEDKDKKGLQISTLASGSGKMISYSIDKANAKEERELRSDYIKNTFFNENSKEYSGISGREFSSCIEILGYINELLKKEQ